MMRSDADILAALPIPVVLGGKSFQIAPQIKKWNRRFCERCDALLGDMDSIASVLSDLDIEAVRSMDVVKLLPILRHLLAHTAPDLLDLIYEYSQELNDARDHIEDNATVDECMEALMVCVRLAFGPFVKSPMMVKAMTMNPTNGATASAPLTESMETPSPSNSPSENGA